MAYTYRDDSEAFKEFDKRRSRAEAWHRDAFVDARRLGWLPDSWPEQDQADYAAESRATSAAWDRRKAELIVSETAKGNLERATPETRAMASGIPVVLAYRRHDPVVDEFYGARTRAIAQWQKDFPESRGLFSSRDHWREQDLADHDQQLAELDALWDSHHEELLSEVRAADAEQARALAGGPGHPGFEAAVSQRCDSEYRQFRTFLDARCAEWDVELWRAAGAAEFRPNARDLWEEWLRKRAELAAQIGSAERDGAGSVDPGLVARLDKIIDEFVFDWGRAYLELVQQFKRSRDLPFWDNTLWPIRECLGDFSRARAALDTEWENRQSQLLDALVLIASAGPPPAD